MTTKTLSVFEDLVFRATYNNEFVEEQLQALLEPVFDAPWQLTNQYYNEVKRLLFLIANMNKSTNFGYFFYQNMQNNPFPFCDEVLKSAVLTEKYYNLHDKALKAFIRSYMIKNGAEPRDILNYDSVIPEGHGTHFLSTYETIHHQKINIGRPIKPDVFNILYISVNNDQFPMTQKKVSCIIAYLQLDCMLPALVGKATNLINRQELSTDKVLVLMHYLLSISCIQEAEVPDEVKDAIHCLVHYDHRSEIVEKFYAHKKSLAEFLHRQSADVYALHLST